MQERNGALQIPSQLHVHAHRHTCCSSNATASRQKPSGHARRECPHCAHSVHITGGAAEPGTGAVLSAKRLCAYARASRNSYVNPLCGPYCVQGSEREVKMMCLGVSVAMQSNAPCGCAQSRLECSSASASSACDAVGVTSQSNSYGIACCCRVWCACHDQTHLHACTYFDVLDDAKHVVWSAWRSWLSFADVLDDLHTYRS